MEKKKNKVLVIGWDAADWKIINKLMDKGEMPTMEKLVSNGTIGNIATLDPPFSPMLWTTIATGVRPDKHGILGFIEPTPDSIGVRPVSSTSRKVKAIWNILTQKGYKTHVVGWWPSHPAEPINGIMVSNNFQLAESEKLKPLPIGTVHPKELTSFFSHLRIHPSELTKEHLVPFVNHPEKIDQDKDVRFYNIAKILSETSSIHNVATWIAENEDWDFLAVYFDAIDHFCHGFMNHYPPKMKGIKEEDFQIYKDVIDGAYKFHDMMLERMLQLAGEDTTVIILSDHGFHSDHLRPVLLPEEPAGPSYQHRDLGVFLINGPNIKKDERIYGASLLDITPTLLYLYDLPVGLDMDGTPLIQVFENPKPVLTIPSWETVEGESGMLPKDMQEDPYNASESLRQLVELGYIEEPEEDMKKNVEKAIEESEYNLARVYIGAQRYYDAIVILDKLVQKHPYEGRFVFRLIESLRNIGETNRVFEIISKYREEIAKKIISVEELEKIKKEEAPEGLSIAEKERFDKTKRDNVLRNRRIYKELLQADIVDAELLLDNGKTQEALIKFKEIESKVSKGVNLTNRIAIAYTKMNEWDKAIEYYKKALKADPENHHALTGLAACNLSIGENEIAAEYALDSIGVLYHNATPHYYLAEALVNLNAIDEAINALKVCLTISSNFTKARTKLIELFEQLGLTKEAEEQKKYFDLIKLDDKKTESRNFKFEDIDVNLIQRSSDLQTIYIVSGLPRSGTSLMMQMLEKAGLEVFTDNQRKPDDSNPNGYYEHEAVKRLARDKTWVKNAVGKTVKVVSQLLTHLPSTFYYKIIFMVRDIDEVVKSQHQMLVKEGKASKEVQSLTLKMVYEKNLEKIQAWAKSNYNLQILFINHKDIINSPNNEAQKVIDFLGVEASATELAKIVDKKLYRSK
ncbi:MAG: alkaline phosphatase family protein [Bacteroidales bacterium]|nr:alkaline phosphatase family protein [Bacteroidales bacterium]